MAAYPLDVATSKTGIHSVLLGRHPEAQDMCFVFSKTNTEKYKCSGCNVTIEVVFDRDVETGELIGCNTVHEFWRNHQNVRCTKNYIDQLRTRARYLASQQNRGVLTREQIDQLQQQLAASKEAHKHRDGSLDACLDRIRDLNEQLQTALDDRDQLRIQRDQYRSQLSKETDKNQQLSKEFDGMQLVQDVLIDNLEEQNTKIAELREKHKEALLELKTLVDSAPTVSVDDISKTLEEMLDHHDKNSEEVKGEEDEKYEEEEEEQTEMKPAETKK